MPDADDVEEPDDVAFRQPLPPDDRLWRHPSELGTHGASFWARLRRPWRVGR